MERNFRITDVHLEGVAEEFDRLMLIDLEELLEHSDRFIDTGCPACHSRNVAPAFKHQGLNYRRCNDCEMLYISPAPSEATHLDFVVKSRAMAYWREEMPEEMRLRRMPMYKERVKFAARAFAELGLKPAEALEIGAGNGEFAELALSNDLLERMVLLEPQALSLDAPGIEIVQGGFDQLEREERKFDAVFAWEVLEHILEPDSFLRLIHSVLKDGAPLLMSTPNEKSVETRSLGRDSSNILFDHVRLYNPDAVALLLQRNGFRVISITTPGLLDVERLQSYAHKHSAAFGDNPALRFLLGLDEATLVRFQEFLQHERLSSHMRVIAVRDGVAGSSSTPKL